MDSKKEFDGLAAVYAAGRPSYADDFIKDLYGKYGFSANSVIADIGSGTGKFAKQLMEKGSFVYCVEPNEDMRRQAERELKKYRNGECIAGNAYDTSLKEKSVDFVTAAQAFHWFNAELFKKECRRIIKPNGKIFLIWNVRDMDSEHVQKSYEIYKKYCPKFKGFSGGIQKNDTRIKNFFEESYERSEYDNPLYYDKEKYMNRSLSGSYSLKRQDADYEEYINRLEALFDEYADEGILVMPNKTVVYAGNVGTDEGVVV